MEFRDDPSLHRTNFFFFFVDDIEIDIPGEKPKEQNMLAALNKEKLASKFMAFKGQFKPPRSI